MSVAFSAALLSLAMPLARPAAQSSSDSLGQASFLRWARATARPMPLTADLDSLRAPERIA